MNDTTLTISGTTDDEGSTAIGTQPIGDLPGDDAPESATLELAAETMLGDLTRILVDELKAAPDCWQKMSQYAQDSAISRINSQLGDAVLECVKMIAADGRETILATVEQLTAKDGIKAVLTLSRHDENRHQLLDAVGKTVLIVVSDAKPYMAGGIPKADADQRELPLADFGDDQPVADSCPATAVDA